MGQNEADLALTTLAIDQALAAQLIVAWAGETGDVTRRLGWWRSDMASADGGEDLFRALLPHTWRWAVLEAAWEAARRREQRVRQTGHDPDRLMSLFYLGPEADEAILERLQHLKGSGVPPTEGLPALSAFVDQAWNLDEFRAWIQGGPSVGFEKVPMGRHVQGTLPESLGDRVERLVAALYPLAGDYPFPHFTLA